MGRMLIFSYGLVSYAVFFSSFLYSVGFLENRIVPKSIDSGGPVAVSRAIMTNALLLGLFAVQHSVMARGAFKRWWTRFVPEAIERSTYVLLSGLVFFLLFWQWQPMTGVAWTIGNPFVRMILKAFFWMGWALVVLSSFLVNHFELFGLRQVYLHVKGQEYSHVGFKTPVFYKIIRHPIMFGYLIAFWSTPHMTIGRLLFAGAMSIYILIGVRLEERDLASIHGAAYAEYQQRVSMLLPIPKKHDKGGR